jgi:hypothetical protein
MFLYIGGNSARRARQLKRCDMKTITRKQARETIESKGIEASLRIGKTGLTAKQRRFAEGIVLEGLTGADSYRQAYNTQGKPQIAGVEAHKLKVNPKVANMMEALERAKAQAESHSAESLRALCVSTLVDVATNSDRDAVRVAAVRVLGSVVGVDAYRETKRIETVKDSDEIKAQIMQQLKTIMLDNDSAVDVDANDLLSELTAADPTHAPPPESDCGTPPACEHTIPLEQSQDLLEPILSSEPTPMPLEKSPTPGGIFSEDEDSYQDITVSSYSKQMTTK